MIEPTAALVWCPFPDREAARKVAGILLDEKLIACANIMGDIESLFEWNGERGSDVEVAVLFKTTQSKCDHLVIRLGECHPYDTPAIVGWSCDKAHPATLDWLALQTGDKMK
uniref:divalent-cation tolerance protein CutA n=1 Tax=uncultured Erythrobacter sp. TaxID=263913 RepID=UPI0026387541|nr:divalent-cation tolerance protein CutA [uncultured Erythrobacter sp.]